MRSHLPVSTSPSPSFQAWAVLDSCKGPSTCPTPLRLLLPPLLLPSLLLDSLLQGLLESESAAAAAAGGSPLELEPVPNSPPAERDCLVGARDSCQVLHVVAATQHNKRCKDQLIGLQAESLCHLPNSVLLHQMTCQAVGGHRCSPPQGCQVIQPHLVPLHSGQPLHCPVQQQQRWRVFPVGNQARPNR